MGIGVEVPEGVYKTRLCKLVHPSALIGKEARRVFIGDRIVNIYRFVTDIVVSTYYKIGMVSSEVLEISVEVIQKSILERLSNITGRT